MTTSAQTPFLHEILSDEPIPIEKLAYFRERFRDRLYELVIDEFLKQEQSRGLSRADVARRIHRRPEQITRWFGAPGNWTLETVSDLLLAISKAEPNVSLLPLDGRPVRNYDGQDHHLLAPLPVPAAPDTSRRPRSAKEGGGRQFSSAGSFHNGDRPPSGPRKRLLEPTVLS